MTETDEELLEGTLDDLGLPWKRREGGWVVPASPQRPCEVLLSPSPEGLGIEAELCSWETLGEVELRALALVLEKANVRLCLARGTIEVTRAILAATLPTEAIGSELRAAVEGVLLGCRTLTREVSALLAPGVAREVLQFFASEGERKLATERI